MNRVLLSDVPDASAAAHPPGSVPGALVLSTIAHVVAIGLLVWMTDARAGRPSPEAARATSERTVWIVDPGPSGGGGGRRAPAPLRRRPEPPQAARTADVPKPAPVISASETAPHQETSEPQPAVLVNLADVAMAGAANPPATLIGGGSGQGSDRGIGDGAGPGDDTGFGEGAYRPGNGVTPPVPVRRVPPRYTADAMRARAQGIILVECVVEPTGECGDVRIVRTFAPPYGLDREALDAARQWHFRPGTRGGEPVPVLVSLEIAFNIR